MLIVLIALQYSCSIYMVDLMNVKYADVISFHVCLIENLK